MTIDADIELEQLIAQRADLVSEKSKIGAELAAMGISGNRAYFARGTIEKEVWDKRTELAARYSEIEKLLFKLNRDIKLLSPKRDYMGDIIKETFGFEFLKSVLRECKRRRGNLEPFKVTYNRPVENKKTFLEEYQGLIKQMIDARRTVNQYIEQNEPEINKADYLLKVKKLNNCLPAISELEKLLWNSKK
jgi:hypothetical protein